MCGIFGWLRPGGQIEMARAVRATNALRHRGPDDEGYLMANLRQGRVALAAGDETTRALNLPHWQSLPLEGADLVFGFRRLSIHDLSEAGHQPMGTPDGKLWIVFNGEVYNFIELRAELESHGIRFQSRTDTEVILRAYEKWGPDCLPRFNGMWGLAILDLREDGSPELFLARDRCGVKPLYYADDRAGGLVFASEAKAISVALPGLKPEATRVANFLAWGRNSNPLVGDSYLEGVQMVPPGCYLKVKNGAQWLHRYWEVAPDGDGTTGNTEDTIEKLRFLLEDSVRLRLRADVPVGSCLSGGLDSSLIVGMVNRLLQEGKSGGNLNGQQHAFSAVYDLDGPWNEEKWIKRVLEDVPAEGHYTRPGAARLVKDFDAMIWHQEEPFGGTSIFAQWCVMSLVKDCGIKVLLDGQASDEIFAGYRPFRFYLQDQLRRGDVKGYLRALREIPFYSGDKVRSSALGALPIALMPGFATRAITKFGYLRSLRRAASEVLVPSQIQPLLKQVADPDRPESYPWRRVTETMDQHLRGLAFDFGMPHLLRFEDRNSMAFSVESRVPFTDYRIIEFAFSPAMQNLKIHGGWSKWALRKAGQGLVPEEIIWRKDKMGFGTPEIQMIQELAAAREQTITSSMPAAEFVEVDAAKRTVHAASQPGCPKEIAQRAFRIMAVDSWLKSRENEVAPC